VMALAGVLEEFGQLGQAHLALHGGSPYRTVPVIAITITDAGGLFVPTSDRAPSVRCGCSDLRNSAARLRRLLQLACFGPRLATSRSSAHRPISYNAAVGKPEMVRGDWISRVRP
jgi:hypothetical protein